MDNRICVVCGSATTFWRKDRKNPCAMWYSYQDGFMCSKCHTKFYIKNNPEKMKHLVDKWQELNRKRRMNFTLTNKVIMFDKDIRKGQCEKCGNKLGDSYINCEGEISITKMTQIHHTKYDPEDPLANTIELCVSCHAKESYRLGQLTGLPKGWYATK